MTNNELKKIIEKHEKWLKDQEGGERADLHGVDLYGANLRCANLSGANLSGANLSGASLCNANLSNACLYNADLHSADLYRASLSDADLRGANLQGTFLCEANLCNTYLYGANLCGANLRGANLHNANLCGAENVPYIPLICPESGSFTAWKIAQGYIVKLLIPEDARRSNAVGRKCRCDKATVVAIKTIRGEPSGLNEIASDYDENFIYKIGETVVEPNFCEDRFEECAEGIHFFINRQEAVNYN